MKHLALTPSLTALGLALAAAPAAAQIVVVDGDSLVDVVATAPDGETIIIQSDATFTGTLSWEGKALTIRAGFGYTPTIKGDLDSVALKPVPASPPTYMTLEGVRIEAGDPSVPTFEPDAISWSGTSGTLVDAIIVLDSCAIVGDISASGTGDIGAELTLTGSQLDGEIVAFGTGSARLTASVIQGSTVGGIRLLPTGTSTVDLTVAGATVDGQLSISSNLGTDVEVSVRRSTIRGEVEAVSGSAIRPYLLMESCLLVGDGSGTGLTSDNQVDVLGVNLTITGFATGLDTQVDSYFHNLALFGNGEDLAPVVLPSRIADSLIEDGTYAGFSGNFGGTPLVDSNYALLPGSIGIDAGDSFAPELGVVDLQFDPRVQDSDGNGAAQVNVGAIESLGSCAPADFAYFNGSGINPAHYSIQQPPVLGSNVLAGIQTSPDTAATIVAVGVESGTQLVLPGFEGELLLNLAPAPILDVALGNHSIPVPADGALCGAIVGTQGLRVRNIGGIPTIEFLNGARLRLGL